MPGATNASQFYCGVAITLSWKSRFRPLQTDPLRARPPTEVGGQNRNLAKVLEPVFLEAVDVRFRVV